MSMSSTRTSAADHTAAAAEVSPPAVTAPRPARRYRDLLALDDFERHAKRLLPPMIYQYVAGGAETGAALRNAFAAYARYAINPRMFVDVSNRQQGIELFGHTYNHPFGISPLGGAAFVSYRADIDFAKAALAANIPVILSASALVSLEDVIAVNPQAWFQAYLAGDQPRIDRLVDRVARAGYKVLVITGDTPILGNREHNLRSGFSMPIRMTPKVMLQSASHPRWLLGVIARTFLRHGAPHFENTDAERGPPMMSKLVRNTAARDQLSWQHVRAIRARWKGALVIKGIMSPHDARMARSCGADAVILSNHGGRQLDHAIGPLDRLPEAVADKGDMKVIIDSGIRRGTDVIKAMALGADAVFLGRPFLYASVVDGEPAVKHAIKILAEEIDRDMALTGVQRLAQLSPDFLHTLIATA